MQKQKNNKNCLRNNENLNKSKEICYRISCIDLHLQMYVAGHISAGLQWIRNDHLSTVIRSVTFLFLLFSYISFNKSDDLKLFLNKFFFRKSYTYWNAIHTRNYGFSILFNRFCFYENFYLTNMFLYRFY